MAENTINDFNTLPEQVQINKEDIETNTEKIATNTANIANNTSDITKLQDDKGYIQFTTQGWKKFNTITETDGQTIILNVPGDLLEHVKLTGNKDVILQFVYNGHAVFENIHLHPNKTIETLDNFLKTNTYYTGQAILVLPSQDNGLFDIVYVEAGSITLHLITIL